MLDNKPRAMRDVFIERIYEMMPEDKRIFFLCADFGSPVLDKIRRDFPERFINVGIAEQNLINVAAGLALEGFIVYAYAISPFLTMRAYEQSRNNLSLLFQTRDINVNLVGVGAGLSYDVSGPTHHCLEDIAVMGVLPNFNILSFSDWVSAQAAAEYTVANTGPKYLRFDAKPCLNIYDKISQADLRRGFRVLCEGKDTCLISTGFMTRRAMEARNLLEKKGVSCGLVDIFGLKPANKRGIKSILKKYKSAATIEEGFVAKGGLDAVVLNILNEEKLKLKFTGLGFKDKYVFELGGRDYLHEINGLDAKGIVKKVLHML